MSATAHGSASPRTHARTHAQLAMNQCNLGLVSHQVALSEKLRSLMTEIQEGGSNKKNFLLAN